MPDSRDTGSKGARRSWDGGCPHLPSGATPLTLTLRWNETATFPGLAVYLDGSLERGFRPADLAGEFGALLQGWGAAASEEVRGQGSSEEQTGLCVLTIELSGAHADV